MKVNKNRIYQTIIDLEGPRHPITSMAHLNYTADYIIKELETLKIAVEVQNFQIKGSNENFRNIIGSIGQVNESTIMLSSHYDTVQYSPGANDNLSAVAVILEIAKIIKKMDNPPNVSFAFFTLEEGNPVLEKAMNQKLIESKIINKGLKYKSLDLLNASKSLSRKTKPLYSKLYSPVQVYEALINTDLSASELQIVNVYLEFFKAFPDIDQNTLPVVGSSRYANSLEKTIKCLINFDCIGWIKKEKGTQKPLPLPDNYQKFFEECNMDLDEMVGNYIGIAGDVNSSAYLKSYSKCLKTIPHLSMDIPLNHDQMKQLLPDLLRSDHRPFWKKGIPALFVTDLANFRSELYHTPADQSQHIDYDMLEEITEATIRFINENQTDKNC